MSMGDPAGVGPGITAQAWQALHGDPALAFYIIGAPDLYRDLCPVQVIGAPAEAVATFADADSQFLQLFSLHIRWSPGHEALGFRSLGKSHNFTDRTTTAQEGHQAVKTQG